MARLSIFPSILALLLMGASAEGEQSSNIATKISKPVVEKVT